MEKISEQIRYEIREKREKEGLSIDQIAEIYHIGRTSAWSIIKDCDHSNVKRASPTRKVVKEIKPSIKRPNLSTTNIGEAARNIIIGKMMLKELSVFRPTSEDTSIDLLVLKKNGTILKCQCKSMWIAKNGSHTLNLTKRERGTGRRESRVKYLASEVDFFLGYCLENDSVYVVPYSATKERKRTLAIWVLREPCNCNRLSVFDYKSYENNFELLK